MSVEILWITALITWLAGEISITLPCSISTIVVHNKRYVPIVIVLWLLFTWAWSAQCLNYVTERIGSL